MEFQLDRDLVFFDVEATGLNVLKDRIIQIGLIKYFKDGREPEEFEMLINPSMHISQESMEVHGITPDMVRNKPTFIQAADKLWSYFENSDLAGYNSDRFDIPMLMEEFNRAGKTLDITRVKTLDIQKIFYKMEPRTLVAALKYYCGEKLENAHDALADVQATVDVFKGMISKYKGTKIEDAEGNEIDNPINGNVSEISAFLKDKRTVDVTNRFKYASDGSIVFNFGKYIGQPVAPVLYKDRQYYQWILDKDFSIQVKQIVKKLFKDYENKLSGKSTLFD